jgi:hypothetical protein
MIMGEDKIIHRKKKNKHRWVVVVREEGGEKKRHQSNEMCAGIHFLMFECNRVFG